MLTISGKKLNQLVVIHFMDKSFFGLIYMTTKTKTSELNNGCTVLDFCDCILIMRVSNNNFVPLYCKPRVDFVIESEDGSRIGSTGQWWYEDHNIVAGVSF
jgi:hypothetical protein